MKSKIIKEIITIILTASFIVLLTMSFGIIPALGNFLNPLGIWTIPGNTEYPDNLIIRDSSLSGQVEVNIDIYGVPHIEAETDNDLFFAVGYIHAFNRLFEMDMFRRYAAGRLSEILGEDYIEIDKYYRLLGFDRAAEKELESLTINFTDIHGFLQSYCNGINKFIELNSPHNLPIEYYLLTASPEPFVIKDILVFKYFQAWSLTPNLDLDFTLLKEKLPEDVYDELYPNWSIGLPFEDPIIPNGISKSSETLSENSLADTIIEMKNFIDTMPEVLGPKREGIGSNNWVVNGSKSTTGNPILCGDPHLVHQLPSIWYEMHLISNELNVTGVGFPGTPFILLGHNEHISWSLTNTGGDSVIDYYDETMNDTHYYYDSQWIPIEFINSPIEVKGGNSIPFIIRKTVHGPIITDLLDTMYSDSYRKINLSIKFNALEIPSNGKYNSFKALYEVGKAKNWSQYNQGLSYWDAPAQNFVYADNEGNIAMNVAGLLPIRKQGINGELNGNLTGTFVQPGNGTGEEWGNFIPYNELPQILNPDQCYLASANQRPINDEYPYYLGSNSWSNGYRARRINEFLRSSETFSIEDMKKLQSDNFDYAASQFIPILIETWNYSLKIGQKYDSDTIQAMNELYAWNKSDDKFIMNRSLIAPTIWWRWIYLYEENTWKDEFSKWDALGLSLPAITILENLTKNEPNSNWFNDTNLPNTQDRNYTLLKSLNDTVEWLTTNLGSIENIENWVWGSAHQILFEHLTQLTSLSRGPFLHDGSNWVPNNAGGTWDPDLKAYIVTFGPSWRMVVDLGNQTTPINSVGVYPGGQSGNPISKHYDDLLNLWLNYEYHDIYFISQEGVVEATILFMR
jgi:penicillin amidase